MSGADRDRICGDELIAFMHLKHIGFGVELYGDICTCAFVFFWRPSLRMGLVFQFVGCLQSDFAPGLDVFYRSELKWLNVRNHYLITGLDRFQFARIQLFKEMNVAVKFFGDCIGSITVRQKF